MYTYTWSLRVQKESKKQLRSFIEPYLMYSVQTDEEETKHSFTVTLTMTFGTEQEPIAYMTRMEDVYHRVTNGVVLQHMKDIGSGRLFIYENTDRPYSDAPTVGVKTGISRMFEHLFNYCKRRYNQIKQERS